ncbi:MAG: hypothetical protein WBF13_12985 [Candidatus Zixiibacteriota bacterium]
MFGIEELKERIEITETTVECPVKGCNEKVERQRVVFKKEDRFKCPKHNIVISSTTFEYPSEVDNLLWKERSDGELLEKMGTVKRESRMARDNSEDAVSWNVFRFLERNNLIEDFLSSITGNPIKSSEVIYWSYSQKENTSWSEFNKARKEFGEEINKSSEPDIIITTDKALFLIEAKLTASNETKPSDESNPKKYETGGDNWFSKVLKSPYKTIAIDEKKYELLRFWLLGTWMAQQQDLDFYLINLVLSEREPDIEAVFKRHINESQRRRFLRVTWERIYQYIAGSSLATEKDIMVRFFKNKTIGYKNGTLERAFSIP